MNIEIDNNSTVEYEISQNKNGSTGGGVGTSDYLDLSNKPKINNVELRGNKTLNDLGIQPKGNYLTKVPEEYITEEELNNAIKDKADTSQMPTKLSQLENDEGYLKEHQDLSDYAKKTDIPNMTNYYNKTEIDTMIGNIESLLSEV